MTTGILTTLALTGGLLTLKLALMALAVLLLASMLFPQKGPLLSRLASLVKPSRSART